MVCVDEKGSWNDSERDYFLAASLLKKKGFQACLIIRRNRIPHRPHRLRWKS